jgi:hypothetical protein
MWLLLARTAMTAKLEGRMVVHHAAACGRLLAYK